MSDKPDETPNHNSSNEAQGTEDNTVGVFDRDVNSIDNTLESIQQRRVIMKQGLKDLEKLKLSTLEGPVFYSYYDLWSEESNKLFKRSAILKKRYFYLKKKKEQAG